MSNLLQTRLPERTIEGLKSMASLKNFKSTSQLLSEVIHSYTLNPRKVLDLFEHRLSADQLEDENEVLKPFRATVSIEVETGFKQLAKRVGIPFERLLRLAAQDAIMH